MDDRSARASGHPPRHLIRLLALTGVGLLAISSRRQHRISPRTGSAPVVSEPSPAAASVSPPPVPADAVVAESAARISFFDEVLTENLPPRRRSRFW